ncbi:MAG: DUF2807 domain-containing protein [Bacteroidota bacterium]
MKYLKLSIEITLFLLASNLLAQKTTTVASFDKVIISPHIESTFVKGSEESVTILDSSVSEDKINIEVNGGTLRVYLDDAKEVTKHEKVIIDGVKRNVPIYKDKVLTIVVTYKNIDVLSLRGEQRTLCKDVLDAEKFKLKIYGESEVVFNEVNCNEFDAVIYGESNFTIKKGTIDRQKITAYGEGIIDLVAVNNRISKLKAFGEAEFTVQSSEHIKFTAYGEAQLHYKGSASISKGISIGDYEISRID